jgi:hypothetical protein
MGNIPMRHSAEIDECLKNVLSWNRWMCQNVSVEIDECVKMSQLK